MKTATKTRLKSLKMSGGRVVMALLVGYGAGTAGAFAQTAAPATPPVDAKAASATPTAASAPKLSDKQKALADQADKLVAMATELKNQVDRTNKNILSVKVVLQAEEIERYARQIKDQAKK